jgi:hypothetical protein
MDTSINRKISVALSVPIAIEKPLSSVATTGTFRSMDSNPGEHELTADSTQFASSPVKIVLRNLFRWLSLLLLLGISPSSKAGVTGIQQSVPVASFGTGPQFAIADFDGDVRPDLASIQSGVNNSGTTNYWIELQLSTVGQQAIQLFAPAGGLRIEARDVNGDHSVDLVLATAWFRRPVAILLNDGHGVFSHVEPTTFPEAFSESTTNWRSPSNRAVDAFGIPPQSQSSLCSEARYSIRRRLSVRRIALFNSGFLVSLFLISQAGRAPPSEVPHS